MGHPPNRRSILVQAEELPDSTKAKVLAALHYQHQIPGTHQALQQISPKQLSPAEQLP